MDDFKLRLNAVVAEKLSPAPQSADKAELIEELSDNLYRRFLDMTGAGVPDEDAFQRALDDLGDVDELLAYLGVDAARESPDVVVSQEDGRTRIKTKDGQTIVINTGGAAQEEAEPSRKEAGSPFEGDVRYGCQPQGAPESRRDESGDSHDCQAPQSDLDAIFATVAEACRVAVDQTREAVIKAKDAIQRRTTVEKENGHVRVHFNAGPVNAGPGAPVPPEPPEPSEPPEPPEAAPTSGTDGWEFEAELNSDEGRFFAGAGPKQRKDVIYGFGYDKAKGGFFAQWGEYQGDRQDAPGPRFSGQDSYMEHQDDGTYSVTALRDLRGIEVQTVAGDVSIRDSEAPDAGVIIDGDVDDLDVTCTADGILIIREGRTASSSFFSRRGIGSADVELSLPRRRWEMISVTTASGDLDLDGRRLDIDQLNVKTASGDASVMLRSCNELRFHSASGDLDLDLKDGCVDLAAETMSGDVTLRGSVDSASLKTVSGDIQQEGLVNRFLGSSMSGDVEMETARLPQVLRISSKSGDCRARIPDAGPFTLHMMTTSGEISCAFRMDYVDGTFVYGDGTGPAYSLTTISGDVTLERY